MPGPARAKAKEKERFSVALEAEPYSLRLYVAGSSLKSTHAIQIVSDLCASFPKGRCNFEVVDLYQQPGLAKQDDIIAIPSLVKVHPPPRRTFIGMTEDRHRILQKLGIPITMYGSTKKKTR